VQQFFALLNIYFSIKGANKYYNGLDTSLSKRIKKKALLKQY
jgi:hypothetical protein